MPASCNSLFAAAVREVPGSIPGAALPGRSAGVCARGLLLVRPIAEVSLATAAEARRRLGLSAGGALCKRDSCGVRTHAAATLAGKPLLAATRWVLQPPRCTVAILVQGTSWAVKVTQAFLRAPRTKGTVKLPTLQRGANLLLKHTNAAKGCAKMFAKLARCAGAGCNWLRKSRRRGCKP